MPGYTFIDKDLLNTALRPHGVDNTVSYTTKTTYRAGLVGPKVTTFIPLGDEGDLSSVGEINWKAQTFSIDGLATRWEDLRAKPEGVTDSTREWHWIGKRFLVKYSKNVWLARVGSPHGSVNATFTIRKPRVLAQSSPAKISFSPDVSVRDRLFLLLVMVYCETKRQERKEKATVAVAAGHLAIEASPHHRPIGRG